MVDAIILIIVAVIIIFAIKGTLKHFKGESPCCGGGHDSTISKEKKLSSPVIGKITVKISGMHCQHCVNNVTNAINSIEGASAKVDLAHEEATILYDRPIDMQVIYQAIENAGYQVVLANNG